MPETKFKKDLYRYEGQTLSPPHLILKKIKRKLLCPYELRWLKSFRKAGYYSNKGILYLPIFAYWIMRYLHYTKLTQIQIGITTEIGEGFFIGHCGRIIINSRAKLGKNVNIATGVTIGTENRGKRKGCPTISDNVWIGTNAVIVGRITIGTDVLIAPNSYVNFDVPPHSIVIGNPARIISCENATESYIHRPI